MTTLRLMVYRHAAFYSPILGGIAGGFLVHGGFEPTYAVMPPRRSVGKMIASGEIHVSQSAVSASWPFLEKGEEPPFLHFGQINQRDGAHELGQAVQTGLRYRYRTLPATRGGALKIQSPPLKIR